jgi:hypothetical protein
LLLTLGHVKNMDKNMVEILWWKNCPAWRFF